LKGIWTIEIPGWFNWGFIPSKVAFPGAKGVFFGPGPRGTGTGLCGRRAPGPRQGLPPVHQGPARPRGARPVFGWRGDHRFPSGHLALLLVPAHSASIIVAVTHQRRVGRPTGWRRGQAVVCLSSAAAWAQHKDLPLRTYNVLPARQPTRRRGGVGCT